jgi:hypothetical protein
MQVAAEHPEAERQCAGTGVKEWLLFYRIALHAADVPPRHSKDPSLIEAHAADAIRALRDRALVPARIASEAFTRNRLDELGRGLGRSGFENFGKRGHGSMVHVLRATCYVQRANVLRATCYVRQLDG